jgi:hypothetical protein
MINYFMYDIIKALEEKAFPTIVSWNRLEGRPRTENFDRALRAEVRDPLWMLSKQWQMGEFKGDDAGSPVFSKIHLNTTQLNKYKASENDVQLFEQDIPMEAKVEQRAIPFKIDEQDISLDIRLLMGRQWIKMVSKVGDYAQYFIDKYKIKYPEKEDAQVYAHLEVMQQFAAVSGRCMDGAALYFYLKEDPANHAYDDIAKEKITEDKYVKIEDVEKRFIKWFEDLYYQPHDPDNNAWKPSNLEYQFACSAPEGDNEKILVAEEYYHGHLDWYSVNIDKKQSGLGEVSGATPPDNRNTFTKSFIPTPIKFSGMPNTRWWTFEEGRTNFGDINPDTTDLAKLLLMEFGLIHANDWFILPFTLPAGSIAKIKGMTVTNVFGERVWIEAAGKGLEEDYSRWSMFTVNTKDGAGQEADMSLLILPTVPKIQESEPLESVTLIRDEMANMVWGIETRVPLAHSGSKSGHEAAIELHNYYKRRLQINIAEGNVTVPAAAPTTAKIRYKLMSTVPENWIPFIPVHVDGDIREIQLQRAAMPRILEGGPKTFDKIRPRTVLIREGLDNSPEPAAYYIHEEEVPRAGVQVSQSFKRTRGQDGKVFTWLSVLKKTARGEGSSALCFDQIDVVKQESSGQ